MRDKQPDLKGKKEEQFSAFKFRGFYRVPTRLALGSEVNQSSEASTDNKYTSENEKTSTLKSFFAEQNTLKQCKASICDFMVINSDLIRTGCRGIVTGFKAEPAQRERTGCQLRGAPATVVGPFSASAFSLGSSEGVGSYSLQMLGALRIIHDANLHGFSIVNRSGENNAESRVSSLDFVLLGNVGVLCVSKCKEAPTCSQSLWSEGVEAFS